MKMLLIIVSMTFLLKPVFPVLEYFVNYDYIVKELCQNKEKPELKCNGKCHLTKELANAAEPSASNSNEKKVVGQQNEVVFFQEILALSFTFAVADFASNPVNSYTNNYFHLALDATFHPPTVKLV